MSADLKMDILSQLLMVGSFFTGGRTDFLLKYTQKCQRMLGDRIERRVNMF
jgi:hypothetical protein